MIHAMVKMRQKNNGAKEGFLEEVVSDLGFERFIEVGQSIRPVPSSRGKRLGKSVVGKQGGTSKRFRVHGKGSKGPGF